MSAKPATRTGRRLIKPYVHGGSALFLPDVLAIENEMRTITIDALAAIEVEVDVAELPNDITTWAPLDIYVRGFQDGRAVMLRDQARAGTSDGPAL